MRSLKNNYRIFSIFLLIPFFFSCNLNNESIERNYKQSFLSLKAKLDKSIKYVEEKYYSDKKIKSLNRLQFILDDGSYMKGTIFTDNTLSKQFEETIIYNISFEKSSQCLDKYAFDIVKFKLKNEGQSYQYYYVFEFCPLRHEIVDTPNFKSIPLDAHWFLEIEKS